jgi:uncharacterized membrane protein
MPDDNSPEPNKQQNHSGNQGANKHNFKGFDGSYNFEIKAIFRRAYSLSTQNNWMLVLGLACIWAATFTIYVLYLDAFDINDITLLITNETPLSPAQQILIELTMTFALAPLWTGVTMFAINTARKISLPVLSIFHYFKILPAVALAAICIDVLFKFGFMLFFIPGFYIVAATTFALPLIADKNMTPIKAVVCSIKMSNVYLVKMMQLYLLFLGMLIVVFISFGFAYLWIGPFYFNVKAIIYQDLFCDDKPADPQENNSGGGVFNA